MFLTPRRQRRTVAQPWTGYGVLRGTRARASKGSLWFLITNYNYITGEEWKSEIKIFFTTNRPCQQFDYYYTRCCTYTETQNEIIDYILNSDFLSFSKYEENIYS